MIRSCTAPGDDFQIRCRKLGHEVPFSYCRRENGNLPCFKTLDCWYDQFLVEDLLRSELRPEEWEKIFMKPAKPKVLTLVDLIEQSKRSEET